MGHRTWQDVRREVVRTPDEESRVAEIREAMEVALRLSQLRRRREVTQVAQASAMSTTQGNISRIEHQDDLFISTLRDYVGALGGQLQLRAVFPDETVEILPSGTPR